MALIPPDWSRELVDAHMTTGALPARLSPIGTRGIVRVLRW